MADTDFKTHVFGWGNRTFQDFQTRFILFITCIYNEDVSTSDLIASDSLLVSVWQVGQTVKANTHRRSWRLSRNLPLFICCLFIDPLRCPGYIGLDVRNGGGKWIWKKKWRSFHVAWSDSLVTRLKTSSKNNKMSGSRYEPGSPEYQAWVSPGGYSHLCWYRIIASTGWFRKKTSGYLEVIISVIYKYQSIVNGNKE